jgi:hypothetical protein
MINLIKRLQIKLAQIKRARAAKKANKKAIKRGINESN